MLDLFSLTPSPHSGAFSSAKVNAFQMFNGVKYFICVSNK